MSVDEDHYLPESWGDLPKPVLQTRGHVREWVDEERDRYADRTDGGKYRDGTTGGNLRDTLIVDQEWGQLLSFVGNYLKRAEMMGLNTESGRQALGKVLTSATNILEKACEEYGPMPEPGYTSGEITPWTNPSYPLT